MIQPDLIWADVERIRLGQPLVHNITNFVVMNTTANALLALGASPVMAYAEEEAADMAGSAGALVINIGTLNAAWVVSMKKAMLAAKAGGIPIVFDPVGAGATAYRSAVAAELLSCASPSVIRGNASELLALAHGGGRTKGVDSTLSSEAALTAARSLSEAYSCVVSLSGKADYIIRGKECVRVCNGHPLMPRVTGLGCTATALSAAFAAVNPDVFLAAAHAMAVMGIAGELAAQSALGPGSFQTHFIDALYTLNETDIRNLLKTGEGENANENSQRRILQ